MISRRQRWSCPVSANKPVRERSEQVKVITSSSSLADLHSQIPLVGLLEQLRCSSSRLGIIHETRNTWRARRLLHPRRSDSLSYFVFNQQCQFSSGGLFIRSLSSSSKRGSLSQVWSEDSLSLYLEQQHRSSGDYATWFWKNRSALAMAQFPFQTTRLGRVL